MLVLTRLAGESLVIANQWKLTVHSFENARVRLQLWKMDWPINTPADLIADFTLAVNESKIILPDVTCKLAKIIENKIRLGFSAPKSIDISRYEFFDALRQKSPSPD